MDAEAEPRRGDREGRTRSFTDVFIKYPVLAVVVNLVILLVGWRALTTLPVQQYPKIESSSVVITTVYYGASAETVRGFLTTPIERVVSAISGGRRWPRSLRGSSRSARSCRRKPSRR